MRKFATDLKAGQFLMIGDTKVTLERKSGQLARLVIEAGESTEIKTPARKSALHLDKEHTHGEHAI